MRLDADVAALRDAVQALDQRSEACRQILIRGFWGRLRWLFFPNGARPADWHRTLGA